MLRTTNTFSKKSCLETTYNYSAPQTLNMIERLSAECLMPNLTILQSYNLTQYMTGDRSLSHQLSSSYFTCA